MKFVERMFRAIFGVALAFGVVAIVSASSTPGNRFRGGAASLVVRTTVPPICTVNVLTGSEQASDAVRLTCRNYSTNAEPLVRTEGASDVAATDAVVPSEAVGSSSEPAPSGDERMVDEGDRQSAVVVINF